MPHAVQLISTCFCVSCRRVTWPWRRSSLSPPRGLATGSKKSCGCWVGWTTSSTKVGRQACVRAPALPRRPSLQLSTSARLQGYRKVTWCVALCVCDAPVKECVQNLGQEDDKENLVASLWGAERCLRVLESVSSAGRVQSPLHGQSRFWKCSKTTRHLFRVQKIKSYLLKV